MPRNDEILELPSSDLDIEEDGPDVPVPVAGAEIDPLGATHPPVSERLDAFDELDADPLESEPTRIDGSRDVEQLDAGGGGLARVVIIGGNDRGREQVLKLADNSIGRGLDNDIVLADIAVSRKHTLICSEGDTFVVRDLGSGNGTIVNGQRIDTHVLVEGDQIELGNTMLRFHGGGRCTARGGGRAGERQDGCG